MQIRISRYGIATTGLGMGLFLLLLWQPSRQVRLHQRHLLHAIERRNWSTVGDLVSPAYRDQWQQDRSRLLADLAEVFRQFLACSVEGEERALTVENGEGSTATRITLRGSGSELAEYAKQRVNGLREPFLFKWRQRSWKPWDWQLVEVRQPELRIENLPDL